MDKKRIEVYYHPDYVEEGETAWEDMDSPTEAGQRETGSSEEKRVEEKVNAAIESILNGEADPYSMNTIIEGKNILSHFLIQYYINREGDDEALKKLKSFLSCGISVIVQNDQGNTCLHDFFSDEEFEIVDKKCLPAVDCILKAGFDTNLANCEGDTVLTLLCKTVHDHDDFTDEDSKSPPCAKLVSDVIRHGANVKEAQLLHKATIVSCTDILECLISNGADVMATDDLGCLPLHYVEFRDKTAVQNCDGVLLKYLDNNVDIDSRDCYNHTPLLRVTDAEITKFLLQHEASVNVRDNLKRTPLHQLQTTFNGKKCIQEVTQMFLDGGADINVKDVFQNTPLHTASTSQFRYEKIKALLSSPKIDVTIRNQCGQTILHLLTIKDYYRIPILIQRGADVNSQDIHGSTPLHYAVWHNNVLFVEELMLTGKADPAIKDSLGKTPCELAQYLQLPHLVDYFHSDTQENDEKHFWRNYYNEPIASESDTEDHREACDSNTNCNADIQEEQILYERHTNGNAKTIDIQGSSASCSNETEITETNGMANIPFVLAKLAGSSRAHVNTEDNHESEITQSENSSGSTRHIIISKRGSKRTVDLTHKVVKKQQIAPRRPMLKVSHVVVLTNEIPETSDSKKVKEDEETADDDNEEDDETDTDSDTDECICDVKGPFVGTDYTCTELMNINMENVDDILAEHQEVINKYFLTIIKSSCMGLHYETVENSMIISDLSDFIARVCGKVGRYEPMFRCTPILTGSMFEGTRVGLPDEFDFMCVLEELSQYFVVDEEQSSVIPKGYVSLKTKSDKPEVLWYTKNGKLIGEKVMKRFRRILHIILCDGKTWDNNHMVYDDVFELSERHVCRMWFLWTGPFYKTMRISLDLVGALSLGSSGHVPFTIHADTEYLMVFKNQEEALPTVDNNFVFPITTKLAEAQQMKEVRSHLKKAYILLKSILSSPYYPKRIQRSDGTPFRLPNISSYMMKMTVLKMNMEKLISGEVDEQDSWGETQEMKNSVVANAVRITKRLKAHLQEKEMKSVYIPDVNILNRKDPNQDFLDYILKLLKRLNMP